MPRTIGSRSTRWRRSAELERIGADLNLALGAFLDGALVVVELLGGGLAHSHGPVADAAHHHALDDSLPADRRVALSAQLAVGLEQR